MKLLINKFLESKYIYIFILKKIEFEGPVWHVSWLL